LGAFGDELVIECRGDRVGQNVRAEPATSNGRGSDSEALNALGPVVLIEQVGNENLRNPCSRGSRRRAGAAVVNERGDTASACSSMSSRTLRPMA